VGAKRRGWLGEEVLGLLGFVALVCVYSIVVVGACVRDCRGLGLCMVGTVGSSLGGDCV
jgi:hypothetical protein